jgi:tRNA (guanosine-2'-O-)-methyltransferase
MDRLSAEAIDPAYCFPPRPWGPGWTPNGVIECLQPLVNPERQQRLRAVLGARIGSVTVLLDAPHDPHNGAAILRSCDAFGIPELHVVTRRNAFLASNIVARGAERWVDVIAHTTPASATRQLTEQGFELVSTHPQGELIPEDLAAIPRVALVLGNEHEGIGEELTQSAGRSVRIPMVGFVESLNLSVSAAILLREATRARPADLSEQRFAALYAQGLYRSVKQAALVLGAMDAR